MIGLILGAGILVGVGVKTATEQHEVCLCPATGVCSCGQPSFLQYVVLGVTIVIISAIGLLYSFLKPSIPQVEAP